MPRHRVSRAFYKYEAWPDELQIFESAHLVCPQSPEINVKTVCKPLMIIAAHSLLRPLDTAQKRAREIVVRADLVSGEIDKLFPVNEDHSKDFNGNRVSRDKYRGRCRYARVAAGAGQTAVECATLAVKLAHYILHQALADGLFGIHRPSLPWALPTMWSRILHFPAANINRPGKDEIDAALAALKAAMAECQPPDDIDAQFCECTRDIRRIPQLLELLDHNLRAAIRGVEEFEKTIAYSSGLWWQGTTESTLFSAKAATEPTEVAKRAARCLAQAKAVLHKSNDVVKGATPASSAHQAPPFRKGKPSRLDIGDRPDCFGGFSNALSMTAGATAQADAVLAVAANAYTLEEKMNGWEII